MRFNTGHAEVRAEGFSQQAGFSIAASGKAFKGLIDGLYSRKIEAIIRELSTNAFDGQIAAGFVGPFRVHLPSALDPVFWVRDYGTGMSHQQVMTRYPTLFDSTKDGLNPEDGGDPNAQVGCLGLGSKSFFAYTDACTLTVWQDGEMRVYSIFMGADGVPQVALAGALPSDEPAGVKVEFAVRTKDFHQFTQAAERVYKGFPILPDGLPITVKNAIAIEPLMMGDGWKAFPKDYLPGSGFYARQGCVLYPIDLVQVDGKATEDDEGEVTLSSDFQRYSDTSNTIVLDFPIGSIGFDLSRERLSYDDSTVQALRQRWGEFSKDLSNRFRRSFKGMNSSFDKMKAAYRGPAALFGSLFSMSKEQVEASALLDRIWSEYPKNASAAVCGNYLFYTAMQCPTDPDQAPKTYRHKQMWNSPKQEAVLDAIFVFIDEKKPNERRRIGRYMFENDIKWAFLIEPKRLTLKTYRELGKLAITRLSDMPLPPKPPKAERGPGGYGGGGTFSRFKFLNENGYVSEEARDVDDADLTDHLFMLINRGEAVHPRDGYSDMSLDDIKLIHQVVARHRGINITLINTRSNEPFEKWEDFPMAYDMIDNFVEDMSPRFVKWLVDTINRQRFHDSHYQMVLAQWQDANPYSNDPISRLRRFERRWNAIPEDDRRLCNAFYSRAASFDGGRWGQSSYFLDKIMLQVIERGRRMGLEILPPMGKHKTGNSQGTMERLLPKRWEKIVHLINRPNQQRPVLLKLLLKDITTSC